MKLAPLLPTNPDHRWTLASQVGVNYCVTRADPSITGLEAPYELDALRFIQQRFADAGLTLIGLEADQFEMRRIKLGLPGRDEDIERYIQMLRNLGSLGMNLMCYNFMPQIGWHRTAVDIPIRGGARVSGFRLADLPDSLTEAGEVSAEQIWSAYTYFIQAVVPEAEAAGVEMSLHPDDPPLASIRGVARIFGSPGAYRKAFELAPSPAHGACYCQANFKLMDVDIADCARELAADGRIKFIHWRDVSGTADDFQETSHDDGPTDMAGMLKLYHELGFDGPIRTDHVPTLEGEENADHGYAMYGRLFAIGYLKGICEAYGIPVA